MLFCSHLSLGVVVVAEGEKISHRLTQIHTDEAPRLSVFICVHPWLNFFGNAQAGEGRPEGTPALEGRRAFSVEA